MLNVYSNFSNVVNKSAKLLLFFSAIFLTGFQGYALSPTPTAALDPATLPEFQVQEAQKSAMGSVYQIGDRIALLVEVKTPIEPSESLSLKLPDENSKLEDQGWYIDPSTQFLNGSFRFIASPIQTGKLILPPLLILKNDQTAIGRTTIYTIQVTGPKATEGKPPELLDPISIGLATKYWIYVGLGFLCLIALVSYFYRKYFKNRKSKARPQYIPVAPIEPEHVTAFKKLHALYIQYPYQTDSLKPACFGMSEILKEFFSTRFKIDAREATTDEMIELLRNQAVSSDSLREIQLFFKDLDQVKFTKKDNYLDFNEEKYLNLKLKAEMIIQKWALHGSTGEVTP